jgi:hypothetical protein
MPEPDLDEVRELLAQRRDKRLGEPYWQGFLQRFHQNRLVLEQEGRAFSWKLRLYLLSFAYLAVTLVILSSPGKPGSVSLPSSAVHYVVVDSEPAERSRPRVGGEATPRDEGMDF